MGVKCWEKADCQKTSEKEKQKVRTSIQTKKKNKTHCRAVTLWGTRWWGTFSFNNSCVVCKKEKHTYFYQKLQEYSKISHIRQFIRTCKLHPYKELLQFGSTTSKNGKKQLEIKVLPSRKQGHQAGQKSLTWAHHGYSPLHLPRKIFRHQEKEKLGFNLKGMTMENQKELLPLRYTGCWLLTTPIKSQGMTRPWNFRNH